MRYSLNRIECLKRAATATRKKKGQWKITLVCDASKIEIYMCTRRRYEEQQKYTKKSIEKNNKREQMNKKSNSTERRMNQENERNGTKTENKWTNEMSKWKKLKMLECFENFESEILIETFFSTKFLICFRAHKMEKKKKKYKWNRLCFGFDTCFHTLANKKT